MNNDEPHLLHLSKIQYHAIKKHKYMLFVHFPGDIKPAVRVQTRRGVACKAPAQYTHGGACCAPINREKIIENGA